MKTKNKIKLVSIVFFILLVSIKSNSQDISGKWTGRLTQEEGGVSGEYYFEMNLKQTGKTVTGFSLIKLLEDPTIYGKINLTGSFNGEELKFKETSILNQKVLDYMEWCIKKGNMKFIEAGDEYQLNGRWTGYTSYGTCSPGGIYLSKKKIRETPQAVTTDIESSGEYEGRELKPTKIVEVSHKKLKIKIYDHLKEDHDTVSISYNDKWILEKYELKNMPIELEITIDTNAKQNYLILHAHNLGNHPPNTAAVSYYNNNIKETIVLKSDMNQSDIIQFKLK